MRRLLFTLIMATICCFSSNDIKAQNGFVQIDPDDPTSFVLNDSLFYPYGFNYKIMLVYDKYDADNDADSGFCIAPYHQFFETNHIPSLDQSVLDSCFRNDFYYADTVLNSNLIRLCNTFPPTYPDSAVLDTVFPPYLSFYVPKYDNTYNDYEFYSYPKEELPYSEYTTLVASAYQHVINLIAERNIKTLIMFGPKFKIESYDGTERKVHYKASTHFHAPILMDFADNFKYDTNVMGYDLDNEPRTHKLENKTIANCEIYNQWIDSVKLVDTAHLITIGLLNISGISVVDPGISHEDFLSWHPYWNGNYSYKSFDDKMNYIKGSIFFAKQISNDVKKPVLIGETGISTSYDVNVTDDMGTPEEQKQFAQQSLDLSSRNNVGYLWWYFNETYGKDGTHRHFGTRELVSLASKPVESVFSQFSPDDVIISPDLSPPDHYGNTHMFFACEIKGQVVDVNNNPVDNALIESEVDWTDPETGKTTHYPQSYSYNSGYFTLHLPTIENTLALKYSAPYYKREELTYSQLLNHINTLQLDDPHIRETVEIDSTMTIRTGTEMYIHQLWVKGNGTNGGTANIYTWDKDCVMTDSVQVDYGGRLNYHFELDLTSEPFELNDSVSCPVSQAKNPLLSTSEDSNEQTDEEKILDGYLIYPNPCNDILNVESTGDNRGIHLLKLYTINGNCIYRDEFISKLTIRTEEFTPGIYFMQLSYENTVKNYKIIIR